MTAAAGTILRDWTPLLIDLERERTRRDLAFWLLVVLAASVLFGFVTLWIDRDLLEGVSVLLGPLFGLAGTAVGFYFGGNTSDTEV